MLYQSTRSMMGRSPSQVPSPVAPIGHPRHAQLTSPQYKLPQYPDHGLVPNKLPPNKLPIELPIGGGAGVGQASGGGKWPWENSELPERPWAAGGDETEIGPSPRWQAYHESIKPRAPVFGMNVPLPGSPEELRRKQAMWEYQKKLKEWQGMKEEDWNGKMPGDYTAKIHRTGNLGGGNGTAKKLKKLTGPNPLVNNIPYRNPYIPYRKPYTF